MRTFAIVFCTMTALLNALCIGLNMWAGYFAHAALNGVFALVNVACIAALTLAGRY